MSSQEPYDVIIVGAGISGIASARCFLDIHPKCRLAVIERDGAVRGTWSAGLYKTFYPTPWLTHRVKGCPH